MFLKQEFRIDNSVLAHCVDKDDYILLSKEIYYPQLLPLIKTYFPYEVSNSSEEFIYFKTEIFCKTRKQVTDFLSDMSKVTGDETYLSKYEVVNLINDFFKK